MSQGANSGLNHRSNRRLYSMSSSAMERLSLLLSGIVGWVDVIDASRTDELNLENALFISGPGVVRVLCRIDP
jgi:hypothetical protein